MACRILRDSNDRVVSVLAPNGEPSLLFRDIAESVNNLNEAVDIYKDVSTKIPSELNTVPNKFDKNGELKYDIIQAIINTEEPAVKLPSIANEYAELFQQLIDTKNLNCS